MDRLLICRPARERFRNIIHLLIDERNAKCSVHIVSDIKRKHSGRLRPSRFASLTLATYADRKVPNTVV